MSIFRPGLHAVVTLAALLATPAAFSHISFQTKEAPIASTYKAVLAVPHGCEGSPTTAIRVGIPDGVVGVKPQPKPGWTLETVTGEYDKPYTRFGAQLISGVKEVVWKGGPLLDEHYDEFVFIGYLSNELPADSTLHFPVRQECEQGSAHWVDIPAAHGHGHHGHSHNPAPGLKLLPKK